MKKLIKNKKFIVLVLLTTLCSLSTGVSFAQPQANAANGLSNGTVNSNEIIGSNNAIDTKAGSGKTGDVKTITLQEAINMAMIKNPDVLSVSQDVYLREQDIEKAHYYSRKIRDVENGAKKAEDLLNIINQQIASMPDKSGTLYDTLVANKEYIEHRLEDAESYRVDNFNNAKIAYLYEDQARIALKVTEVGQKVAKQKISLLVSKQYFDAIKCQKLADVKKMSYQRALAQENAGKASYESGFRAKDDFLLAKAQADLMKADYENALMDYENACEELKATIGMDQSIKIKLAPWNEAKIKPDLEKGLKQGLQKRLEIQQAQGELDAANLNLKIAKDYLQPGSFDYDQAQTNVAKAQIELQRQNYNVEKDIRQAYQSLLTTNAMSEDVKTTLASAKESASIAEYRYREGFGLPSPIMKALNSEDLAGTTVEVLAAQEKLMDVEEKIIEIEYNSNLAKVNYLVNIAEGL